MGAAAGAALVSGAYSAAEGEDVGEAFKQGAISGGTAGITAGIGQGVADAMTAEAVKQGATQGATQGTSQVAQGAGQAGTAGAQTVAPPFAPPPTPPPTSLPPPPPQPGDFSLSGGFGNQTLLGGNGDGADQLGNFTQTGGPGSGSADFPIGDLPSHTLTPLPLQGPGLFGTTPQTIYGTPMSGPFNVPPVVGAYTPGAPPEPSGLDKLLKGFSDMPTSDKLQLGLLSMMGGSAIGGAFASDKNPRQAPIPQVGASSYSGPTSTAALRSWQEANARRKQTPLGMFTAR